MKEYITAWVRELLIWLGLDPKTADLLNQFVIVAIILLIAVLVALLCRWALVGAILQVVKRTKAKWDDRIFHRNILRKLTDIIPVMLIFMLVPLAFPDGSDTLVFIRRLCVIYIIVLVLLFANLFLKSLFEIFNQKEAYRDRPLRGLLQTFQVLLFCVGAVVIISVLIDRSPYKLLAGLGASAAILMLVFKDSILGFVSGIQLSANNMLRPGDWITMPKYGVDGTVTEVSLNTVKVQNFDNTIVTLPPYALVSDSFQNWRGMQESGGRRVKRSINIDMNSVKFCTPEMIARYRQIDLIRGYIDAKEEELHKYNTERRIDDNVLVNSRRQTNIGVFRAYLNLYLKNLEVVNHDMTYMVRYLQPTEIGIPIELYFFSRIKEWVPYEGVQADVFDHIMAIVPEFDLFVFQNLSGIDVRRVENIIAEQLAKDRKTQQEVDRDLLDRDTAAESGAGFPDDGSGKAAGGRKDNSSGKGRRASGVDPLREISGE